jgi:hypothetical protein
LLAGAANAADQALLLRALIRQAAPGTAVRFATANLEASEADSILAEAGNRSPQPITASSPSPLNAKASRPESWLLRSIQAFEESRSATLELARTDAQRIDAVLEVHKPSLDREGPEAVDVSRRQLARQHVWIQWQHNGEWKDLDPTRKITQIDQRRVAPDQTSEELPEAAFHHLEINTRIEERVGTNLETRYLLKTRWRTADLAGADITYAHVETLDTPSLTEQLPAPPPRMQRYTPILIVDDEYGFGESLTLPSLPEGGGLDDAFGGLGRRFEGMMGRPAKPSTQPAGERELTAVFLELVSSMPDGRSDSVDRPILDRIGYAARAAGLGATTELAAIPASHGVHAPFLGMWNIAAWTGERRRSFDAGLVPSGSSRDELTRLSAIHRSFYALRADLFARLVGPQSIPQVPSVNLSVLTWLVPTQSETPEFGFTLDVIRSRVWHTPTSTRAFSQSVQWAVASLQAERLLFAAQEITDGEPASEPLASVPDVSVVFREAARTGMRLLFLEKGDDVNLSALAVSATAKARLRVHLQAGLVAIVPEGSVVVGNTRTVGWWLLDPLTGAVIDEMEDGVHAAGRQGTGESPMVKKKQATAIPQWGEKVKKAVHRAACAIAIAVGVTLAGAGQFEDAADIGEAVAAACNRGGGRSGGNPRAGGSGSASGGSSPPPGLASAGPAASGWNSTTPHGVWPPVLRRRE